MGSGIEDEESRLGERLAALGRATTLELRPDATITPLTLDAATDEHVSTTVTLHDLPRLSLRPTTDRPGTLSAQHDYAITKTLGEGGMGRVYAARQRSLAREVAVKTLKPGAPPAVAGALLREARLTGALEHPGVVPVHTLGVDDDGHPILVMKRVDGVELSVLLKDPTHPAWHTRGRNPDRLIAAIEILVQVCLTLELAHSRGVLHRDVKPENVMVGAFGEVYLLDWGIAHVLDEPVDGELVGTPAYMAPEMLLGAAVDARTDVYLLGATLHEVLTGQPRHQGTTVSDVIRAAAKSAPYPYDPTFPEPLAELCNRATSRSPDARPASVEEMREALTDYIRHRSARALADTALERLDRLEAMLASQGGALADLAGAYRLVTEARFGLTQSLREHRGDPMAQRAMQRCLAAAIELELRQEHADPADALLREMDPPDEALAERIAAMRARVEAKAERLGRIDHDLDPTHRARQRTAALTFAALVVVAVIGMLSRFDLRSPGTGMFGAVATTLLLLSGLWVLRSHLLTNAFNRRLASLLVVLSVAIVGNRMLGILTGAPRGQTISVDLLIMTAMVVAMAITTVRRLAWVVPVLVAALVVSGVWPDQGPIIFGAGTVAAILLSALILGTEKRNDS